MLKKLIVASLGVAVITGCSTLKVDPAAYKTKKIAVVAVYGPKTPSMTGFGLTGGLQGATSNWTGKVLTDTYDEMVARMSRATGANFAGGDRAPASANYAKLPTVMGDSQYVNYKTLRPLRIDEASDATLGALAKELKVDAVMLVSHYWTIDKDPNGGSRPTATDMFEIVMVGTNGTRLFHQKDSAESAKADLSGAGIGMSLLGGITDKDAAELTRDATMRAIDKFVAAWNEKKAG